MREEFTKPIRREAGIRSGGQCEGILPTGERCINGPPFDFDHRIPWAISRDSSLSNCQCLCKKCHKAKTVRDQGVIAKCVRISDREMGIKRKSKLQSRGFAKASPQHSASRPLERKTP